MESSAPSQRDYRVDLIKGMALLSMFGANMMPHLQPEYHSLWILRALASLTAPLLSIMAGVVVWWMVTYRSQKATFSYFGKRALGLMGADALVYVGAYSTLPFISFDVLPMIALSLCLTYGVLKSTKGAPVLLGGAVLASIAAGYFLRQEVGYRELPTQIKLEEFSQVSMGDWIGAVPLNICVDGWFPLLPWGGFVLFGALLPQWKQRCSPLGYALKTGALLVGGGILAVLFPSPSYIREGYIELFYYPSVGFMAFMMGLAMALYGGIPSSGGGKVRDILQHMGRHSLWLYVLQYFVIQRLYGVYTQAYGPFSPAEFFGAYIALVAMMVAVALGKEKWINHRRKHQNGSLGV